MTDAADVDPPEGWRVSGDDGAVDTAVRYEAATGTAFVVAVVDRSDGDQVLVRFSTVTPTNVRHDYPVAEYESRADAVAAAEAFAEHVARALRQDRLSSSSPGVDASRRVVESFDDGSVLDALRRRLRGLA